MPIDSLTNPSNKELEVSEKSLVAILVSSDGPEEVWVLGRSSRNGQPAPEDITLGREWADRLGWMQLTQKLSPQT